MLYRGGGCYRHGARRKRCSFLGCDKAARSNFLCSKHRAGGYDGRKFGGGGRTIPLANVSAGSTLGAIHRDGSSLGAIPRDGGISSLGAIHRDSSTLGAKSRDGGILGAIPRDGNILGDSTLGAKSRVDAPPPTVPRDDRAEVEGSSVINPYHEDFLSSPA